MIIYQGFCVCPLKSSKVANVMVVSIADLRGSGVMRTHSLGWDQDLELEFDGAVNLLLPCFSGGYAILDTFSRPCNCCCFELELLPYANAFLLFLNK